MSDIIVDTTSLTWLLKLAQRKQTIDGKAHSQLYSVILKASDSRLSFTSLVKDGVSSVMRLSIPCAGQGEVVITDIDTTLGVLKYHGGVLTITPSLDKVRFKSTNKQTTLSASKDARAFPHTPSTIAQWAEKSNTLALKINADDISYTTNDGKVYGFMVGFTDLNTTSLYEAFRCDSMNGQKYNKYTLAWQDGDLTISVGGELKGKTKSVMEIGEVASTVAPVREVSFTADDGGGLEHIFQHLNSDVGIWIFDFTDAGMGHPMLITLGDGDFIFQASNL